MGVAFGTYSSYMVTILKQKANKLSMYADLHLHAKLSGFLMEEATVKYSEHSHSTQRPAQLSPQTKALSFLGQEIYGGSRK